MTRHLFKAWLAVLLSVSIVNAANINPSTDLVYLGAFRVPDERTGDTKYSSNFNMGYVPVGDSGGASDGYPGSLTTVSDYPGSLASEIDIPVPVNSPTKSLGDLNTATSLKPFTAIDDGNAVGTLEGLSLTDLQYLPAQGAQSTDKIYWTLYEFYQPKVDTNTFGWVETDYTSPQSIWGTTYPSSVTAHYLFDIPTGWADTYVSGRYLATGRQRVVNGGSKGPTVFAAAPWTDGNPPSDGTDMTSFLPLLRYDDPDGENEIGNYSEADEWRDGAWLEVGSKSAVIITGTIGRRDNENGLMYYGSPSGIYSAKTNKSHHGDPYIGQILFYSTDDLAAVAQGTKQPYEPQPYARWQIEPLRYAGGTADDQKYRILGGVAYDRANQLLYIQENQVDGGYDKRPIIHVWSVTEGSGALDTTAPTTPANVQTTGYVANDSVTISWDAASDAGSGGVLYIVWRFVPNYTRPGTLPLYMGDTWIPILSTTDTSIVDDKLSYFDPPHTYRIEAIDALNNHSAYSPQVSVGEAIQAHFKTSSIRLSGGTGPAVLQTQ